jgi:hypothetical protein
MLGQSGTALAAATVIAVGVGLMPAHSQSPKTPRPTTEPPLDHPIDFYRDLISKGAKLAVHDNSAKTEIVKIRPPAGEGRIVISEAPPYQP